MDKTAKIIKETKQGICTISLNAPEVYNAFDSDVIAKLSETLQEIDTDQAIRCVILRANGKHFSTGANLNWMKHMVDASEFENEKDATKLANMLQTLNLLSKPTIALVQGFAMGGALGLIACCDITIADHDAIFCFSETKLGLVPATIAPYVIRSIGYSATRYLFVTAKRFSADHAKEIGLIHEITAVDNLEEKGHLLAKKLHDNAPLAMAASKKLINDLAIVDSDIIKETSKLLAKVRVSEECQEGMKAFFEKRKPSWAIENENV